MWLPWPHCDCRGPLACIVVDFQGLQQGLSNVCFDSYVYLDTFLCSYCISEERFQTMQEEFKDKHYHHFTDEEENKLIYTDIFKEYVSCFYSLGKRLERVLSLLVLLVSLFTKNKNNFISCAFLFSNSTTKKQTCCTLIKTPVSSVNPCSGIQVPFKPGFLHF